MFLRPAEFVRKAAKLAVDRYGPDIARPVLGFLSAPESVNASFSEYRGEMDTICSFIVDECIVASNERVPIGNLCEQYASWCRSSGKYPCSKVQLGTALTSQSYEQIRGSTGRYWRGLSISLTG